MNEVGAPAARRAGGLPGVPSPGGRAIAAESQSSVDRALGILTHLAAHPGPDGVRPLAAALGLSPTTAFRLLEALERNGYVRHEEGGRYELGPAAVRLGLAALESFDLGRSALPVLAGLAAETGESAILAVLDEGEIVYLMKDEGRRGIRTTAVLGGRGPAHATALGKALLAFLPPAEVAATFARRGLPRLTPMTLTDPDDVREDLARVRRAGFAIDRGESEDGVACVAAPVRDHAGRVVAAIGIAGTIGRVANREAELGVQVAAAGQQLSRELGHQARDGAEAGA